MRITKQSGDTPPPLEQIRGDSHEPAPSGMVWEVLWWYSYDGKQRRKLLFLKPENRGYDKNAVGVYGGALAPNSRYYYVAQVEGTFFGKVGQPKMQKVFNGPYQCLFSPNSRFLCGLDDENNVFRILECETGRGRILLSPRPQVKRYYFLFGWYPDSTHIWYREEVRQKPDKPEIERYYKLNVHTLHRKRISEAERRRLFEDWTMLDPRYRYGWAGMDGARIFAYSLNQRWRVRVEPFDDRLEPVDKRVEPSKMYLEGRDGSVRLLLDQKEHSYLQIVPLDVTDDGWWVLFAGARKEPYKDPVVRDYDKRYFSEIVAVDTRTLRRYMYFDTRAEGQTNTTVAPFTYGGAPFWFSRVWNVAER